MCICEDRIRYTKKTRYLTVQSTERCEVQAPVKIGQIVLPDVAGTGVNVLATKNIQAL